MNKQRVYYYVLYGLLLGGIAGKLIGWITLTHNFFFDWITEGMILLFLLLEMKNLFTYFNPGIKIQQALHEDNSIFKAESTQGWLFVGILVRILGIGFLVIFGLIFLQSLRHVEIIFASMCFYFAGILLVGIFRYVLQNPYALLIDEKGIMTYFFSFKEVSWENLKEISLKADWIALQPISRAVNEVEFENLDCKKETLVEAISAQASMRNIPCQDNSEEFSS